MKRTWQLPALLGVILVIVAVFVAKGMLAGAEKPQAIRAQSGLLPHMQFETALQDQQPTLVLFHSLTCIPCKQMEERVNEVRPDFEDKIEFVDVNVYAAENQSFIRAAQVRAIPTTLLVDAAGEGQTIMGAITTEQLRERLDQLLVGFSSE